MNRAIVHKKQGRLPEALEILSASCAIYEAKPRGNSLDYALCIYNKAMVLGSMSRLPDAAALFQARPRP